MSTIEIYQLTNEHIIPFFSLISTRFPTVNNNLILTGEGAPLYLIDRGAAKVSYTNLFI